jgi:hypothetical protein
MSQLAESLLKCKVNGNTLYLPPISEGALPNYNDVRKALLNAGATYKKNSFIFPTDAQPFIDRLTGGESVNIKKEFQFFATPDSLADRLVELAEMDETDSVLEPSAGMGAIIKAIQRQFPKKEVNCYELMPINQQVLIKMPNVNLLGNDFLQHNSKGAYDRIIANPPFSKNQDIDHIRTMYSLLRTGGRIVTIASKHWQIASNKKEKAFREFLDEVSAEVHELEPGEFKESGTSIAAVIIVIDK